LDDKLEIIIHRVNTINELRDVPQEYGTEIDIRSFGSNLILNHEPFQSGEDFKNYIGEYKHGTLVLNIKEAGIEDEVLRLVRQHSQIKSYFLLDVEFPYTYRSSRNGEKAIAMRFSEDESLETVKLYVGKVDWVWIDTNTRLPLDGNNLSVLNRFKKCLVCPERWGRPFDIEKYKETMIDLNFNVDAVMTGNKYAKIWTE
jgi:hypothetical protein